MTLLEQLDHSKSCTHKPCRSTKGWRKPVYQYWRVWNSPLPITFPKSFMSGIHNRGMSNALIILLVLLCIFLRLFHRFYVGILNFFAPSCDPLYLWECFVFKNMFYLTLTSSGYYLLNSYPPTLWFFSRSISGKQKIIEFKKKKTKLKIYCLKQGVLVTVLLL